MSPFNFRHSTHLLIFSGILSLQLTCIERNNPWDPIFGCHPDQVQEYQDHYSGKIDSISERMTGYHAIIAQDSISFITLQQMNVTTLAENTGLKNSIMQRFSESREIFIRDSLAGNCETATPRDSIGLQLQQLDATLSTANISNTLLQLSTDSTEIENIFAETANLCSSQQILTSSYRNLVRAQYPIKKEELYAKINAINSYAAAVADSNRLIDSINFEVHRYDSLVNHYNDSLETCKIPRETNQDSIKVLIDSIQPGDTIALGEGIFHIEIYLQDKGIEGEFITIIGMPNGTTVFDSSARVEINGSNSLRFENLTFSHLWNDNGTRIINHSSNIHFINCTFCNNLIRGVEMSSSSNIVFSNCRFIDNGANTVPVDTLGHGGIRIESCTNVTLKNILVARSIGIGIDISNSQVNIQQATVTNNLFYGIRYISSDQTHFCNISYSILSYNDTTGIYCNNESSSISVLAASGNRFYLNKAGEMAGDQVAVEKNMPFTNDIDPMYTDTFDYQIGSASNLYNTGIGYNITP
ncbi:MAG: right-handed parallel beta-helix repeat-containing protein [Chitinispirillaceae bacterium]|nr:right-handed parallel beta-helix repeat-containing protein [Chitinispirillaceae bacterium]